MEKPINFIFYYVNIHSQLLNSESHDTFNYYVMRSKYKKVSFVLEADVRISDVHGITREL